MAENRDGKIYTRQPLNKKKAIVSHKIEFKLGKTMDG